MVAIPVVTFGRETNINNKRPERSFRNLPVKDDSRTLYLVGWKPWEPVQIIFCLSRWNWIGMAVKWLTGSCDHSLRWPSESLYQCHLLMGSRCCWFWPASSRVTASCDCNVLHCRHYATTPEKNAKPRTVLVSSTAGNCWTPQARKGLNKFRIVSGRSCRTPWAAHDRNSSVLIWVEGSCRKRVWEDFLSIHNCIFAHGRISHDA